MASTAIAPLLNKLPVQGVPRRPNDRQAREIVLRPGISKTFLLNRSRAGHGSAIETARLGASPLTTLEAISGRKTGVGRSQEHSPRREQVDTGAARCHPAAGSLCQGRGWFLLRKWLAGSGSRVVSTRYAHCRKIQNFSMRRHKGTAMQTTCLDELDVLWPVGHTSRGCSVPRQR